MAVLMFDGFEVYGEGGTGQFNLDNNRWATGSGSHLANGSTASHTREPRTGGWCIALPNGIASWQFSDNLGWKSYSEVWIGFGYYPRLHNANQNYVCAFYTGGYNPAVAIGTEQCYIKTNPNGTIAAYNGAGTLLGTSTAIVTVDIWQYWEVYAKIGNSDGAITVRIDGVPVLSLTNVDTQNHASNNTLDTFILRSDQVTSWYDDVYATDSGFLGPQNVYPLGPSAAGSFTQWDRGGSGDSGFNHSNVDERDAAGPDGDTSFVYTSTASEIDMYTASDLGAGVTGDINAFQIILNAKKVTGGIGSLSPGVRTQGTNYFGYTETLSTSGYFYHDYLWERNPNTGNNWTTSEINAIEIGVRSGN